MNFPLPSPDSRRKEFGFFMIQFFFASVAAGGHCQKPRAALKAAVSSVGKVVLAI
jgi:hypothetical protein